MIVHVLRKPLTGTVAANALQHGCGALNIDGCRIGTGGQSLLRTQNRQDNGGSMNPGVWQGGTTGSVNGRWPANLVHDGSEEVVGTFPQSGGGAFIIGGPPRSTSLHIGQISGQPRTNAIMNYGDSGSAIRYFQQVTIK